MDDSKIQVNKEPATEIIGKPGELNSVNITMKKSAGEQRTVLEDEKSIAECISEGPNNGHSENIGDSATISNTSNTSATNTDYEFDGQCYIYKDTTSGITYKYDNEKQSWIVKEQLQSSNVDNTTKNNTRKDDGDGDDEEDEDEEDKREPVRQDMSAGTYSYEGNTHIYTDPTDGTRYFWDEEKNAWFPKIDDDFLAQYQMNYGFVDSSSSVTKTEEDKKEETGSVAPDIPQVAGVKRKAGPSESTWFDIDDSHNTNVYVSNLPTDITEQEFIDVMQKCGLLMKDPTTGKMKIKLYSDSESGQLKGDGLCTYIRIESVDLALKLIDGYELRGNRLHVERAKFQMKGSYDPSKKPKKLKKKDKEKLKKTQEKLFDWRPDKLRGERAKHECVVVIKNLFQPGTFDKDVGLILEYQQDLRDECSKCGAVKKVVVHDRHPEGVAQIFFKDAEEADICVKLLNGRWFGGQQITADTWDGKTKYKVDETPEEAEERLKKWSKFLEKEEEKNSQENS